MTAMKFSVFCLLSALASASVQAESPVAAQMPYPAIEIVTSEGTFIVELDRPRGAAQRRGAAGRGPGAGRGRGRGPVR